MPAYKSAQYFQTGNTFLIEDIFIIENVNENKVDYNEL